MIGSHHSIAPSTDRPVRPAPAPKLQQLKPLPRSGSIRWVIRFAICITATILAVGPSPAASEDTDIADPFAVLSAVDRASETAPWPGFDASAYPVAIYDGEHSLLLRHPDPPPEFEPLEGRDSVWFFEGKHPAMRWNSNADIGGVRTATLLLTIEPGRSVEYEAHILYHEIFHLFSKPLHPTWRPNEMWRYSYPMEDLDNYRLQLLEEEALARAVESQSVEDTASWASAALALRIDRTANLSEEHRTFETALELQEGTAVYMGRSTIGTAGDTGRLREDRGPEGIRWRCYETGAAVAVILDRLMPSWKKTLDAKPETTFAELLEMAVPNAELAAASFSSQDLAETTARAEASIARLRSERAALYDEFNQRGKKVVIRLADDNEILEFGRFDPMAVEILEKGEALQAHLLTASHPRGEVKLQNPYFQRRSLDGVIALTRPAGPHPFLQGYRQITMTGFAGEPVVKRNGDTVSVEAEGLFVSFDGAFVESTDDKLVITVPSADAK